MRRLYLRRGRSERRRARIPCKQPNDENQSCITRSGSRALLIQFASGGGYVMRRTVTAMTLGLAWLTCLGAASRAVGPVASVPLPVTASSAPAAPAADATQPTAALAPSAFLNTYCVTCHNDRVRAAG